MALRETGSMLLQLIDMISNKAPRTSAQGRCAPRPHSRHELVGPEACKADVVEVAGSGIALKVTSIRFSSG